METIFDIAKRVKPKKQYLKSFIERYDQLFSHLRDTSITLLEIGIGGYLHPNKGGEALRMWSEYFPKGKVVGVDIRKKDLSLPKNVKVHFGSQTDVYFLNKLVEKYGHFDIVIDDASHVTDKTIITYQCLIPYTTGFYIIEDLHMKTAKGTKEYFKNADYSTQNMAIVKQIL